MTMDVASSLSASEGDQPNITGNALAYLTLLLNMIESRDWVSFNALGLQNPKAFQCLSSLISSTEEFNGMTFLHAVARNRPPVEVVVKMITICPESPRARDCLNRTPLHVAAGTSASVEVIKCLTIAFPQACKIQDEDGRTPLHFACDVDCRLFEGEPVRRESPSFAIVHALLSGSIVPASMEDEDEMSPLEYAITSDAEVRVVKMLQKAAQKYMKKMAAIDTKKNDENENKLASRQGAVA